MGDAIILVMTTVKVCRTDAALSQAREKTMSDRYGSAGQLEHAATEDASVVVRDERGMTTAEYAVGVVLVITIVGLIIKALQAGWFGTLVKTFVTLLFEVLKASVG